ncbi:hypothetical protein LLE67_05880 [Xanthomonas campestris]|uniref:hypothetical protein n=1 Tax=Xanthomonas campestris TaxID=339 RepID=UPI001E604A3A|nr:hypothetical protein [Xanthomonas campestris]MCC5067375.1 hypothetical protein [Xanthomonas campestris]
MFLLHVVLLIASLVIAPLLSLLAVQSVGVLLMKGYRAGRGVTVAIADRSTRQRLRRQTKRTPARQQARQAVQHARRTRALAALRNQQRIAPPFWVVISLCAAGATAVWVVLAFPDPAQLRLRVDQLLTYPATRVQIRLREDTAASRQAMLETLTPFLQAGSRRIRYRSGGSRGGSGHTDTADVPSYYRFVDGRFEMVAGGEISSQRLSMVSRGLQALARYPRLQDIPARVPAQLRLPGATLPATLLLHSTVLVHTPPAALLGATTEIREGCHLAVQARVPLQSLDQLRAAGVVPARPVPGASLHVAAPQLFTHGGDYAVTGIVVREGPIGTDTTATQLRVHLQLLPPGFTEGVSDCALALPRLTEPALLAASMLTTFPRLQATVAQAQVRRSARFSPWYGRGWIEVPPHLYPDAEASACVYEQDRVMDARLATVHAACQTAAARTQTCATIAARLAAARDDLQRCLSE